jgi:large subunit ribosomal protein L28
MVGYNVSHSHKKSKRRQLPNIQDKKIFVPELGRTVKIRMSTSAMRTIDKKGLMAYLQEKGLSLKDVTS